MFYSLQAVIVLHEWWGLTEDIQKQAISIARSGGFTTFVPDMYRGKITRNYEEADHWMETLDFDGAVKDVAGAAEFLIQRGCTKVSIYIPGIYIYIYIYSHFVKFLVVVDQVFSISQCRGHAILYTVTKNNVF